MRLAAFDLDGCLVDSSVAIPTAIARALEELGLPQRSRTAMRGIIGPPLQEGIAILLDTDPEDPLVSTVVERYRSHYPAVAREQTRVVDGIPEVLEVVGGTHRLVVVTSKPGVYAGPLLGHLGLDRWFEALHAPRTDEVAEGKGETLARALAETGVDAADAVMVGDRHHDIDAGRALGTRTVGVTWGSGDRAELRAAGADAVVDDPTELPAAVVPGGDGRA